MPPENDVVVLSMTVPRTRVSEIEEKLRAADLGVEWVNSDELWGEAGFVIEEGEEKGHLASMKELRYESEAPNDADD